MFLVGGFVLHTNEIKLSALVIVSYSTHNFMKSRKNFIHQLIEMNRVGCHIYPFYQNKRVFVCEQKYALGQTRTHFSP